MGRPWYRKRLKSFIKTQEPEEYQWYKIKAGPARLPGVLCAGAEQSQDIEDKSEDKGRNRCREVIVEGFTNRTERHPLGNTSVGGTGGLPWAHHSPPGSHEGCSGLCCCCLSGCSSTGIPLQ